MSLTADEEFFPRGFKRMLQTGGIVKSGAYYVVVPYHQECLSPETVAMFKALANKRAPEL